MVRIFKDSFKSSDPDQDQREREREKEGYFFALVAASNEERFSGGHDIGSFEEDVAR